LLEPTTAPTSPYSVVSIGKYAPGASMAAIAQQTHQFQPHGKEPIQIPLLKEAVFDHPQAGLSFLGLEKQLVADKAAHRSKTKRDNDQAFSCVDAREAH